MIFYLGGAEHTAASKAKVPYIFAQDDERLIYMGKQPHPDNMAVGFGRLLKMALNATMVNESMPYTSNDRILRMAKDFIARDHEEEIFLLIMWAPWDRKEIEIDGEFIQLSASLDLDLDPVLKKTVAKFKKSYDETTAQKKWHKIIWDFHKELSDLGIKHLFSIESTPLDLVKKKHKWGINCINPYNITGTFTSVVSQKHSPSGDGFFFEKAHKEYAKYMIMHCVEVINVKKD